MISDISMANNRKKNHLNIGIMQGRFSPHDSFQPQKFPWNDWENEFEICSRFNVPTIEWMFVNENWTENPLITEAGQQRILSVSARTRVSVESVIANFCIQKPLWKDENAEIIRLIVNGMKTVGSRRLIIPLFEMNKLQKNYRIPLENILSSILSLLTKYRIILALETDWEMMEWDYYLDKFPELMVCYDIGNAVGLGRNVHNELSHINNRLAEIHIKDKLYKGLSVMLGEGNVDFESITRDLLSYNTRLILETYFGKNTIRDTNINIDFFKKIILEQPT